MRSEDAVMSKSTWRVKRGAVQIGSLVLACAAAGSIAAVEAFSSASASDPVRAPRRESLFEREIRRFRSFPHLDRAYRLMEAGRLSDARAELTTCLGIDPEDIRARAAYVVLLNRLGDHPEVVRQADELLRRRGDHAPTRIYRGLARAALGQDDTAAEDFGFAASLENADATERTLALESLADLAIRRGRHEEALAALNRVAPSQRSYGSRMRRAAALEALGRGAEAADAYRVALAAARDVGERSRIHRSLAELARKVRNWPDARRSLLAALDLDPADSLLARALGDVAQAAGSDAEAVSWYLKSLEGRGPGNDEDRHQIQMALGQSLTTVGRHEAAAKAFREAARLQDQPSAFIAAARSFARAGRAEEAVQILEQSLRRRPTAEAHLELGVLYARAGASEKALPHLEEAGRRTQSPAREAVVLGQTAFAHHALGNYPQARQAFENALSLDPHQVELHVGLAEVLIALGDFGSAAEHLEQSLAVRDDPAVWRALALTRTKTGSSEEALGIYRRLLESEDLDASRDLLLSMAFVEFERGRHREAADLFLLAFDRHPSVGALVQGAESLALARQWEEAVRVNLQILDLPEAAVSERAEASERLAFAYSALDQARLAAAAFRNAIAGGRGGSSIRLALAQTLVGLGLWNEALPELSSALEVERSAQALSLAAHCYKMLGKPGMTIHYLREALDDAEAMEPAQRSRLFSELSQLYAEAAEFSEAAKACERSLALTHDTTTALRLARMRRLLGETEAARSVLEAIDLVALPEAEQVQILDERAEVEAADKQFAAAIDQLLRARTLEPAAERDYRLGLYYRELGDLETATVHLRTAAGAEPSNARYAESLAYARAQAGHRDDAADLFAQVLDRDGDFLNLYKELAYSLVLTNRNAEAASWFRKAIDNAKLYPVRSAGDQALLDQDLYRMRREVARLENEYDLTAYFGLRSRALPEAGSPSAGLGGGSPSQGGLELAYQPRRIRFGRDRELQVVARVTGFGTDGNGPSGAAYRGALGVRLKPFRSQNLHLAVEGSVGGQARSPHTWLLRCLYSWDRGYDLKPGLSRWNYSLLFADLAHFRNRPATAFYGEARHGVTWNLCNSLLLTPHLVLDGRGQTQQGGNALGAGLGASLKYLFHRGPHEAPRSALEVRIYYKSEWRLRQAPAAGNDFRGLTATGAVQF